MTSWIAGLRRNDWQRRPSAVPGLCVGTAVARGAMTSESGRSVVGARSDSLLDNRETIFMSYEARLLNRLNQLIEKGEEVLSTRRPSPSGTIGFNDFVDSAAFSQWQAGALSFLDTVFGRDSIHFEQFSTKCMENLYGYAVRGQAILKAAMEDLEGGYLISLEELVSADVFSDFLEMARYLLEQGYKDPAASLTGAVLENGLRRIANNNGVKLRSKDDLHSLNQKLADAGVYNRLTYKRVRLWQDVRDNADHGHFAEYDKDVVEDMLNGVTAFLEAHLSSAQ